MLSFRKPLFYSALTHFIIFILLLFSPGFHVQRPVKVIWVELPKGASEEMDLKMKESPALPKTTIQEQKEAKKEPPKEKKKTAPAKLVTKKKKLSPEEQKIQDALAKIDRRIRQKKVEPEAAQLKDKGEGFKYGTGTEPLRVPPSDPEYIAYQAKIRIKMIEEWIVPPIYLAGQTPPRARIVVMINENGEILSTSWEQQSGNASFDSSCLRAVQRASPLPVPPERLKWEAYNEGFLVEFDPSLKGN